MKAKRGGAETEDPGSLETAVDRARGEANDKPSARLQILREREAAARAEMDVVLARLDSYAVKARELGDEDSVALIEWARLAAVRGDHAIGIKQVRDIQAALAPKAAVSGDQRETLIRAVVSLGREAVEEAMRRVRANARSK